MTLLAVGVGLLGPFLFVIVAAIAVPPALVVGACGSFQQTGRLAIPAFVLEGRF